MMTSANSFSTLERIPLDPIGLCTSSWGCKSLTSLELSESLPFLSDTVFQFRDLEVPAPVIGVEDRGEGGIKHLCFLYNPICEVTNLVKQWTNVISNLPFPVIMF